MADLTIDHHTPVARRPDDATVGDATTTAAAAPPSVKEAQRMLKLRKELLRLGEETEQKREEVAQLRRAVNNLREDEQSKQRAITDVETELGQLRRVVFNLRQEEQSKQEEVAQLRRAVIDLRGQPGELKSTDAESLKGDELSAAKAELSAAKDELSAAETKLAAAETKLAAAEPKLAAAKAELAAAKAELAAAKAELAAAEPKLAAAKAELAADEEAFAKALERARCELVRELREKCVACDRTGSARSKLLVEWLKRCADAFSQVTLRELLTSPALSHAVPAISQDIDRMKPRLENELKKKQTPPVVLDGPSRTPVRDADTYLDQPLAWVLANRAPFTKALASAKDHVKPLGAALDELALVHGRVSRPAEGPDDAKGVVRGVTKAWLTFDMGEFTSSSVLGAVHECLVNKLAAEALKQQSVESRDKERFPIPVLTSVPRNSKSTVLQAVGVKLQDTHQPFLTTYNSYSGIREQDWKDPSDIPRYLFARIVASRVAIPGVEDHLIDRIAPHVETMDDVRQLLRDFGGLERDPKTGEEKAMYIAVDEFSKVIEEATAAAGTDVSKTKKLKGAFYNITRNIDKQTFFLFSGFRVIDGVAFVISSGRPYVGHSVPVLRSSDRQLVPRAPREQQAASSTFSQAILLHAVLCLSEPPPSSDLDDVVKDALAYEAVKTSAGAFGKMLEDRIDGQRSAFWQALAQLPLLRVTGLAPVFIDALHGLLSHHSSRETDTKSLPDRIAGWAHFGVVVPTDRNAADGLGPQSRHADRSPGMKVDNGAGHFVSPLMLWYFLHDKDKRRGAEVAAKTAGEEHYRLWRYVVHHWRVYEKLVRDMYTPPSAPASGAVCDTAAPVAAEAAAEATTATDRSGHVFVPAATGSGEGNSMRGFVAEVIVRLDVGAKLIAAGYELIMCTGDTENMDAEVQLPPDDANLWSHRVDAFPYATSRKPTTTPATRPRGDDGDAPLSDEDKALRDQRHGQLDKALRALEAKWNGGRGPRVALLIAVEGYNRACEFAVIKPKAPVVTPSEPGSREVAKPRRVMALEVDLYEVKYCLGDQQPALQSKVRDAGEGIRQLREHLKASGAFDIAPGDVRLHFALLTAKPMAAEAKQRLDKAAAVHNITLKTILHGDLEPTFGGLLLDGDCVSRHA